MRIAIQTVVGSVLLLFVTACGQLASVPDQRQQPACSAQFAGGTAPVILRERLALKTRTLCFAQYALLHSGVSRTPVWSAEHLTAARVQTARAVKRKNAFHAEPALPADERAELADYVRSGFDRGHQAPSGDFSTESAQAESFSLANIVPQNPHNNQHLWEGIEESTRWLAETDGDPYVVTGPLFEGDALDRINGRVLVPSGLYKAIYDRAIGAAGAYVTANAPGMAYQTLSIAALEQLSGINLFPSLPAAMKAQKMTLPVPMPQGRRGRRTPFDNQP